MGTEAAYGISPDDSLTRGDDLLHLDDLLRSMDWGKLEAMVDCRLVGWGRAVVEMERRTA